MKNRTTRDPRAMNTNGMLSKPRMLVIEALEAQAKEGATIDELVELIGVDLGLEHPKMSVGQSLSKMEADEFVVCYRNRWYLKEHFFKPELAQENRHTASANGSSVKIAPMVQKRSGKVVSVYTTPKVYSDAIAIAMLIDQKWWKIPLFSSVRICIGGEAPNWSAEQEMYTGVEVLRITLKNGTAQEERPAPKDIITIAAEE